MTKKNPRVVTGSGNVFADLGYANPGEMLAKSELVRRINNIIAKRGLTQVQASKILRVSQPNVSLLKAGRLSEFSLERLLRFLVLLGHQVNIEVKLAARPGLKVKRPDAA